MTLLEVFVIVGCAAGLVLLFFWAEPYKTTMVAESYEALTGGLALLLGRVQVTIAPVADFVGWGLLLIGLAFWGPLLKRALLAHYIPAWQRLCSRINSVPNGDWDVLFSALAGVGCVVLGTFLDKLGRFAYTIGALLLLFSLSEWKRLILRLRNILKGILAGWGGS